MATVTGGDVRNPPAVSTSVVGHGDSAPAVLAEAARVAAESARDAALTAETNAEGAAADAALSRDLTLDRQIQSATVNAQSHLILTLADGTVVDTGYVKGDPGTPVELQKSATHVQWRLEGGAWADLIPLADLKGAKGDKGDPGDLTPASSNATTTWSGGYGLAYTSPQTVTRLLAGNVTLNSLAAATTGVSFTVTLVIKQAASGGPYTVTWPATLEWANDAPAPAMPTAANAELIVHLFWTGVVWRAMLGGVFFP